MNEIPISYFMFMVILSLLCLVMSISHIKIINIVAGIVCLTLSYVLSKISINGMLVMQFGDITSTDTIITTSESIINLPMSYIFLFIALIAVLITISNILVEIKYNLEPDLEGDFDL